MGTFIETIKYFLLITAELTALFLGISTIVALILMYIPQEQLRTWLAKRGIWENFRRSCRVADPVLRLFDNPDDIGNVKCWRAFWTGYVVRYCFAVTQPHYHCHGGVAHGSQSMPDLL